MRLSRLAAALLLLSSIAFLGACGSGPVGPDPNEDMMPSIERRR